MTLTYAGNTIADVSCVDLIDLQRAIGSYVLRFSLEFVVLRSPGLDTRAIQL